MSTDKKNNVIDILMINNKGFIWNTDGKNILFENIYLGNNYCNTCNIKDTIDVLLFQNKI